MDRLIIIGNGFDLAHGLPTSYKDFIDDYSKKIIEELRMKFEYEDDFFKIKLDFKNPINPFDKRALDLFNTINDVLEYITSSNNRYDSKKNKVFIVKNDFFNSLCCLNKVRNWVDIENEYYKKLLKIINPVNLAIPDFNEKNNEKKITKLNREFEEVKILLEIYLVKVDSLYSLDVDNNPFLKYLKQEEDIEGEKLVSFFEEILYKEKTIIEDEIKQQGNEFNRDNSVIYSLNYFLNFNYTSLLSNYFDKLKIDFNHLNQLHGVLNSIINPINFGFGDEMDVNYKSIEGRVDNEYLKNIKSFYYMNTPNYKKLLDFIDGNKFQIYIMGHSCGLSDRTMLNTIFEHQNCKSIKVFYHQKNDGTDNYTEIIQNISRHFNKKALMRKKIVNKTLCQPLPQIQLPKK